MVTTCPICNRIDNPKLSDIAGGKVIDSLNFKIMFEPPDRPNTEITWVYGVLTLLFLIGFELALYIGILNIREPDMTWLGITSIIVSITFVVFIIRAISSLIDANKYNKNIFPDELNKWKKLLNIYQRLYFCKNDNVVYDYLTKETAPPDKLNSLLKNINKF
jgi:hypothetical protein